MANAVNAGWRATSRVRPYNVSSNLPDSGCSRQDQAVAFRAGELAIGANGCVGDGEHARKGVADLGVERLLDLLVVAVHGEIEQAKQAEIGVGDVQDQVAAAS